MKPAAPQKFQSPRPRTLIGCLLAAGCVLTLASASAMASAYSDAVLADSPYAYWRLGESAGTTAADAGGSYNGTYTGGYTLAQPGAINGDADTAVTLNGTSGYVNTTTLGNFGSAEMRYGFSFEAWFRATDKTREMALCSMRALANNMFFYVKLNAGSTAGRIQLVARNNLNELVQGYIDQTHALDGQWHHLVMATTPDDATPVVTAYLDGQACAVTHVSQTKWTTALNFQYPLPLGAANAQGTVNAFLDGDLDEVALYDHVLTPERVAAHYALSPHAPTGSRYRRAVLADNPYAYWRLSEASGPTAADDLGCFDGTYTVTAPSSIAYGAGGVDQGAPENKAVLLAQNGGTNAYIATTTLGYLGLEMGYGVTYEAWFSSTDTTSVMALCGTLNNINSMGFFIVLNTGNNVATPGAIEFFARNSESKLVRGSITALDAFDGRWHHLVMATTPNDATPVITAYLDGEARAVTHYNQVHWNVSGVAFQYPLAFGANNNRGVISGSLNGGLDEVAFYAHVLTPAEVAEHYEATIPEETVIAIR